MLFSLIIIFYFMFQMNKFFNIKFYFLGYNAKRDPIKGSWFVQKLCKVISENAWNYDLNTMMKLVIKFFSISNLINYQCKL